MSLLKLDLDKETAKQIRTELFRPVVFSLVLGFLLATGAALVASATLGLTIKDKQYYFSLGHSDGWIIFTIFVAIMFTTSVIAYYRLRDEHQKLVNDVLTPFRRDLVGDWRVQWTDMAYQNKNGIPELESVTINDYCYIGIDTIGKLFLETEINGHTIFQDWKNIVDDISINLIKKRLSFYDEGKFAIRKEFMRDPSGETNFEAKFFVTLEVSQLDDKNRVIAYRGKWYDLDGDFAKMKEIIARQLHNDLPDSLHFPRSGEIIYTKAPKREKEFAAAKDDA